MVGERRRLAGHFVSESCLIYCFKDGPSYEQQIREGFLPVWQGRNGSG